MLNMQNKAAGAVGPAVGRRAEAAAVARATIGPENENIDDSESTQFSSESKKNKTTGNGLDRFFLSPTGMSIIFISISCPDLSNRPWRQKLIAILELLIGFIASAF